LEINKKLLEDIERYLYKIIGYENKNQKKKTLLHRGIIIKSRAHKSNEHAIRKNSFLSTQIVIFMKLSQHIFSLDRELQLASPLIALPVISR
jgi:hypothetical protein